MWFSKKNESKKVDFLAVGDVFNDIFIELEDAHVSCNINNEDCTISMRFGDKLPYKKATTVRAVGNAGNAAVSAARLGIPTGLITITGTDDDGNKIIETLTKENISPEFMVQQSELPTNNAYVLQYGPERTILVNQAEYPYKVPTKQLEHNKPEWIYFTSICKNTETFHDAFAEWAQNNPSTKIAFQPGTFQMKIGTEKLKNIYTVSHAFFCNKEEAQRILNLPGENDYQKLHAAVRALGPKLVIITDGPNGLTASAENGIGYHVPMYPDPKTPVDRTGAGDACSSTIIAALSLGVPFEQALLWGPINSMSVVQYIGAQAGLLSREKIEYYLKNAPADYKTTQVFQ